LHFVRYKRRRSQSIMNAVPKIAHLVEIIPSFPLLRHCPKITSTLFDNHGKCATIYGDLIGNDWIIIGARARDENYTSHWRENSWILSSYHIYLAFLLRFFVAHNVTSVKFIIIKILTEIRGIFQIPVGLFLKRPSLKESTKNNEIHSCQYLI